MKFRFRSRERKLKQLFLMENKSHFKKSHSLGLFTQSGCLNYDRKYFRSLPPVKSRYSVKTGRLLQSIFLLLIIYFTVQEAQPPPFQSS